MIVPPTLIPSIITTITKIASSIGPMIAKYAPMVIEVVGKNLPKVVNTVEAISLVADVLKPNERADELGAKAMAAGAKLKRAMIKVFSFMVCLFRSLLLGVDFSAKWVYRIRI